MPADPDATTSVTVHLTNTGAREGKQVIQLYLSRPDSTVERPRRWLAGFEAVSVAAGATAQVSVPLAVRAFAHWDVATHRWLVEPGRFGLHIGFSSADLPVAATVRVGA